MPDRRPTRGLVAAYRAALRLYPVAFRESFEDELVAAFDESLAESRSARQRIRIAARAFGDISRHALAERWSACRRRPAGLPWTDGNRGPAFPGGGRMFQEMLQDAHFALRGMRRSPGFTLAVVVTIALGVGATTAIWAAVDRIVLRPLPFPESGRALVLCETHPSLEGFCSASPPNARDWAAAAPSLETVGVARTESFALTLAGRPISVRGGLATRGFFETLGLRAASGRLLSDDDLDRGRNNVVVITDRFWREQLGADPAVIGRSLPLDNRATTIVGVLPPNPYIPMFSSVNVWKPITAGVDNPDVRSWRGFMAFGKLKPGATLAQLRTEIEVIRARLTDAYPADNSGYGIQVRSLHDYVVGDDSGRLWTFLAAVGLVMAIACANVAGLLMVRSTTRAPEFALRASLGAGAGRLTRQILTEGLLLAAIGGALGVWLAVWATDGIVALAPTNIPRLDEIGIDGRVALFSVALTTIAAAVFSLAPMRAASRTAGVGSLGTTRHTSHGAQRARSALVVGELALALMLLAGTALLVRTFASIANWQPGFDRDGVTVSFTIAPPETHGNIAAAVDALERTRDAVAGVPGIVAVGLGSAGPLFGGTESAGLTAVSGRESGAVGQVVNWFDADAHYFAALGRRLVRGRAFTDGDSSGAPRVAVVNERFASRVFGDTDPLGQRVTVHDVTAEIVGVVSDVAPLHPDAPVPNEIFWPIRQYPRLAAYLVMRVAPGVAGVESAVAARIEEVDPGIQVAPFSTIDRGVTAALISPRFNMTLIGFFAVIAIALASIGVYGVTAATVTHRTRELGIRLALGATPARLAAEVLGATARLAAVGAGLGLVGTLLAGRALRNMVSGVSTTDAATLGETLLLVVAVSLVAGLVPARRAARVDPVKALRAE